MFGLNLLICVHLKYPFEIVTFAALRPVLLHYDLLHVCLRSQVLHGPRKSLDLLEGILVCEHCCPTVLTEITVHEE